MGINPEHLLKYIIEPTLQKMEPEFPGIDSKQSKIILLGTAGVETQMGYYLHQIQGPALGIYQVELSTHRSLWDNYLAYRPNRASVVRSFSSQRFDFEADLVSNLRYQTAIARLKYWARSFEWPENDEDLLAYGVIWNDIYNTNPDFGFPLDFVESFPKEVLYLLRKPLVQSL